MDKASIVKDAIDYIEVLNDQERTIQAELTKLESRKLELQNLDLSPMKKRVDLSGSRIEILELNVSYVGNKTMLVSLKCSKRRDTIVKLCKVFEYLNLNIVTANINAFPESLFNTLFVQGDEEEMDVLKMKIETTIKVFNDPQTPFTM
ncbi:putative helix-loop-helix DNA-binding domain superfamily [Helianthus annuus]|uniref:Helix-loop-helix DNA-binding domain superfamily n=2 Tax=Helianthus annuus TaxID=4232 RepID=A0A9K3IXY9_HELAN|nr:putative helix-loop-helix DNA-binding domain superfamily [Helianthus annuus]KAJ0921690.1 putative transcription factor bHLH family [Helianthus annuus]